MGWLMVSNGMILFTEDIKFIFQVESEMMKWGVFFPCFPTDLSPVIVMVQSRADHTLRVGLKPQP